MSENKPPRKATPKENETEVLTRSRRRCLLCYYLEGDLSEQKGQIAHLDQDPSNYAIDNLAWACLEHHSEFDSSTSQHKNYTIHEAKFARDELHKAIADGKHLSYKKGDPKQQPGRTADQQTLNALMSLMAPNRTIEWLRTFNFAGYSFDTNKLNGIGIYVSQQNPERKFIDAELEALRTDFEVAAMAFLNVVGIETFPMGNGRNSVPQEWEIENPDRFNRVVPELHDGAARVCKTYDALVDTARRKLSA